VLKRRSRWDLKAISADLLVDAEGIRSRPLVLVQNERIVAVGSKGQIEVPKNAELIDAEGLVLMPGLVDCHVHFQGSAEAGLGFSRETFGTRVIRAAVVEARQLLDAGFTSVMDTGGQIAVHVRNAIDSGILPGPRILAAGRHISQTAGHGDASYMPLEWVKEGQPMGWYMEGRIADGVDECIRAVRENLRMNVDFIKICTSGGGGQRPDLPEYTLEELKAMVHVAHSADRRVMVHCYNPEGITRSVLAGVDVVAHANLADEASIKLMKEHGVVVVPTMAVYYRMMQRRKEQPRPAPSERPSGTRMSDTLFTDVKRLYDGGLTLAMGTDTMSTADFGKNALELELYVNEVGLSPLKAIEIATLNAAKAMGKKDLGTINTGKIADLIALKENPLDNIKSLQNPKNVKLVMKAGVIYKNLQ